MEETLISASIVSINPSSLFGEGFELSDSQIIQDLTIPGNFDPNLNEVELFIYDYNLKLLSSDYDFKNWKIIEGENSLELYPINDTYNKGYDSGIVYSIYNFINLELNSNYNSPYYISDISEDRTEIRIKSNILSNTDIESSFINLKSRLEDSNYFDEFYISFGENEYHIAVNVLLDTTTSPYSILIKLYDSLPTQYNVKDTLYVATKVAESQGYQIIFTREDLVLDDIISIKGPNFNANLQDSINNSTGFFNKSNLLKTSSSGSEFHLFNRLSKKGIKLTPYGEIITSQPDNFFNNFENFIHFSSAKERLSNFIQKVKTIENYNNDKQILYSLSPSTPETSANIKILDNNVKNIIENFDRYEHYLYYASSSYSYPKSSPQYPYSLYSTGSLEVVSWLGSDDEYSQYYGGRVLSASLYDNSNQNWLFYTIPEFIRENEDNSQYLKFCNMMGQHFDELWLYVKYITKKLNTTNELYNGVPLELAKEVIESLGYEVQGNNYNNQYAYIGLSGEDNKSFVPPTGSELIPLLNYIAVNIGYNLKYWEDQYSDDYYVERFLKEGWPYAIDDVSKEIYKRLYHNMSYLLKKKGTMSGLRQLVNVWGVPNTILRLNEFGGRNKNNIDNWDSWYKRYSYNFNMVSKGKTFPSSSILIPWMPLNRNKIKENQYITPDTIQFRFKTEGIPTQNFYTQSLLVKKSDNNNSSTFDFGIKLEYIPEIIPTYSGSGVSNYGHWGKLKLYISSSIAQMGSPFVESEPIYLPFFNGDWWSVMLDRDKHVGYTTSSVITNYTLYAGNKIYNPNEGNQIGFEGSTSILSVNSNLTNASSINESWNKFEVSSPNGIYLGGYISGSTVGGEYLNPPGIIFSGSFQEFRYYSSPLNKKIFDNFVMNPESIEGLTSTNSSSSFDILSFRADLGNELDYIFPTQYLSSSFKSDNVPFIKTYKSIHPSSDPFSPLLIVDSFIDPNTLVSSSNYDITFFENGRYLRTNTESYFVDEPVVGIKNRVSNKIQIIENNNFEKVLSSQVSIEQNKEFNDFHTEDINNLEAVFSFQNEINDDISQTLSFNSILNILGDPRQISNIEDKYYFEIRKLAEYYFQKYNKGNIYDYLRLVKFFDNSLFKSIRKYTPARTGVSTGILIKQHFLERNRHIIYSPKIENITIEGSIAVISDILQTSGGPGGVVNKYNKI